MIGHCAFCRKEHELGDLTLLDVRVIQCPEAPNYISSLPPSAATEKQTEDGRALDLAAILPYWPNCATPDCPNKTCEWSEMPNLCFKCGEYLLGRAAMIARFDSTHEKTWAECEAEDARDVRIPSP